jgi:acyl carrier protein
MSSTDTDTGVIADITEILVEVIGDEFLLDVEITPETTFSGDLELESIEFISLAEHLKVRYSGRVDFTAFLAGLGIQEILELSVGRLAALITQACAEREESAGMGAGPADG